MRFNPTLLLFTTLLAACASTTNTPTPTPAATRPIFTPIPTFTITAEPPAFNILPDEPGTLVMDFVARACEAEWSNNAYHLPCPGDQTDTSKGYIEYSDHTIIEGMISIDAPVLIGLPGQGQGNGIGLFGHYPGITVQYGDRFKSTVACQGDAPCNVEFTVEFFDAEGDYHSENRWGWHHQTGDGPLEIDLDLSPLAGQTVEFLLVVRDSGSTQNAWIVWIAPRIIRDPVMQPKRPVTPETPTISASDLTPGVISGWVDMSTAPPYLNDPLAGSSPVVVTFINMDDGTYWYIQTSLTNHPNFQMTVPPGRYQVVAYGRGVGGVPYVTAGYTGTNPSCGNALKTIDVDPNARVSDIIIADWNWNCNGAAERPAKPADVPVP